MAARRLIVHGGRLIDGTGRPPLERATIVIEDGQVSAVDSGGGLPAETDADLLDASGRTVLPGLWDAHTHFYDWMGELYLAHGVTNIIDVGNYVDWILAQRDGVAGGHIRAPQILACGNALGGDAIFAAERHMSVPLDGPDDARAKARALLDQGVDGLKLWVFSRTDEIQAAAEEAHARGKRVVGHISVSAVDAARAGLNVLAHATGLPPATVKDPKLSEWLVESERARIRSIYTHEKVPSTAAMHAMMEEDTFDAAIEVLLERDVFIEPDLVFKWIFATDRVDHYELADHRLFNQPALRYIPDYARRRLGMAWHARASWEAQAEELKRAYHNVCTFLGRFAERGGKLLVGSDTTTWPIPGLSAGREMSLLMDATGISAMDAIVAATRYPAESMGRGETLGTVQPGRAANLILVDGDPLQDILAVQNVRTVILAGQVVDHGYHADYANPLPKPQVGLTHSHPIPKLSSISPGAATEGDASLTMTLEGSGFMATSVVVFDGLPIPTRFERWDRLQTSVPPHLLRRPGTFPVWVSNPLPIRTTDYLHQDERSNALELVVRFA